MQWLLEKEQSKCSCWLLHKAQKIVCNHELSNIFLNYKWVLQEQSLYLKPTLIARTVYQVTSSDYCKNSQTTSNHWLLQEQSNNFQSLTIVRSLSSSNQWLLQEQSTMLHYEEQQEHLTMDSLIIIGINFHRFDRISRHCCGHLKSRLSYFPLYCSKYVHWSELNFVHPKSPLNNTKIDKNLYPVRIYSMLKIKL